MTDPSRANPSEIRRLAADAARANRLVGRDQEVGQMLEAFGRTCRGRGEIVLLSGLSGSGKTSLTQVLESPVLDRNGFFLTGKFNQYDLNSAYVAWRQALRGLCDLIAREGATRRQRWADELLAAVGGQAQLLIDLVPEFEALLGKQPAVDAISPQEARHRFASVVRSTFAVASRPEHPLVLVLDDWQWADPASMRLLAQLQIDSSLKHLLVVAAFRSDETGPQHGFHETVAEMRG